MLTASKSDKMLTSLKDYKKRYLSKNIGELDESGTRIMINTFLTSILGHTELEEIKTEFMIKGTYADYIVQTGGKHLKAIIDNLEVIKREAGSDGDQDRIASKASDAINDAKRARRELQNLSSLIS